MTKAILAISLLSVCSGFAQETNSSQVSDQAGNVLRSVGSKNSDGKRKVVWELVQPGGKHETVHTWTGTPSEGAAGVVELDAGYPGPNFFHLENGVLDVFGQVSGAGTYYCWQFKKKGDQWTWTKGSPYWGYFSANSNNPSSVQWLAPGKWRLSEARAHTPDETIELLGLFNGKNLKEVLKREADPPDSKKAKHGTPAPSRVDDSTRKDTGDPKEKGPKPPLGKEPDPH